MAKTLSIPDITTRTLKSETEISQTLTLQSKS